MLTFKYRRLLDGPSEPEWPDDEPGVAFDLTALAPKTRLARMASALFRSAMNPVTTFLRRWRPNMKWGELVVVTRAEDVRAVLDNSTDFIVPFGPEMTELAGGVNFVLGLEGGDHARQRRIVEAALRPAHDARWIAALSRRFAETLIDAAHERIDLQRDLILRVATESCCRYFGLRPADSDAFAGWALAISNMLFADPAGNAASVRLARNGARRMRAVIDLAIREAHAASPPRRRTLVERFVHLQRTDPDGPSDAEIRAMLVGLVAGFIPTNSLAGGKILGRLIRDRRAFDYARRAAKRGDRDAVRRAVLECARLDPALAPGQWRYCRAGAWIAPGTPRAFYVPPKSTVMVSTLSALRDPRVHADADRFDPTRTVQPELLFGTGLHRCIGAELATVQLTAIFCSMLAGDEIADRLRRVRIKWLGPFPWSAPCRLDVTARRQNPFVCLVPLATDTDLATRTREIAALGNPAFAHIRQALDRTDRIHFASINALAIGKEARPHLVIEVNSDGDPKAAIDALARAIGPYLEPLMAGGDRRSGEPLDEFLDRHRLRFRKWPWGATGLEFAGTPGLSVKMIARQQRLAAMARSALDRYFGDHLGLGSRATAALNGVRAALRDNQVPGGRQMDAFLIKPCDTRLPLTDWEHPGKWRPLLRLLRSPSIAGVASVPLIAWAIGIVLLWRVQGGLFEMAGTWAAIDSVVRLSLAILGGFLLTLLNIGILLVATLGYLRWKEARDPVDEDAAPVEHVAAITRAEDPPGHAQNHIFAPTPLKSGPFRRLTFAFSLWGIEQTVRHWFRPGFVVIMGTIHFARWFRVPGQDLMIFPSNYDGSWESYLEDFITRARWGQSAVWSNGKGFPRTRFLIFDGAGQGDAFKRWVRKNQHPTAFWYSRFPDLTTQQIRTNAILHEGLSRATSESEARAWLACFGSSHRPEGTLEFDEIQSIAFTGFKHLAEARYLMLRLPEDRRAIGGWINAISGLTVEDSLTKSAALAIELEDGRVPPPLRVSFGEGEPTDHAAFVAFSRAGLERCGVPCDEGRQGLGAMPSSFRLGMAERAAALGDRDRADPERWRWSDGGGRPVHAMLALLGATESALRRSERLHLTLAAHFGLSVIEQVDAAPLVHGHAFDHFGFRDGLVQPAIVGTRRAARNSVARDQIAAGEFVIGYRDTLGQYPPRIRLSDEYDPANTLPDIEPDRSDRRFPRFGMRATTPVWRDFGRNGSFIAVRELTQDVDGFARRTADAARHVNDHYRHLQASAAGPVDAEWVQAKLVGRWHSGAPLIGHPVDPGAIETIDHDMALGKDDPTGIQCPLGSHVRRVNPRDSLEPGDAVEQQIVNRHRLIRRGRSYRRGDERGLFFVALCGDLERQFEFVQQSWIEAPGFHGLSNEPDPLVGRSHAAATFSIPVSGGTLQVPGLTNFVWPVGGGYFFLPSRSALRFCATLG